MKIHYSKFPNDPITQSVLQREQIGAVVAAWHGRIFGKNIISTQKTYEYTDNLINTAKNLNLSIHIHPVLSRYPRHGLGPYQLLRAHMPYAMEIVDRYADVTDRWTLATETIQSPVFVWEMVIAFYKAVAERHPNLKLWIGDYGIYTQYRGQILKRLQELKTDVPNLVGFVGQDYVDLDKSSDPIARYLKVTALGTFPLIKFGYLPGFIKQVQSLGLEFALEHTTFSNTPDTWPIQESIYNCLSGICDRTGSEFWLWDCCDASARYFHDAGRQVYTGVWDSEGNKKPPQN